MKTTRTVIALVLALVLATSMAPLSRVHAQGTEVTVDPNPVGANPVVPMGSFFDVFVDIANVGDLDSWQVSLSYNPAILAAVNVQYVQPDSCIPSQPQCFDIPRSPTMDNVNGFVVGGQASVFPPGASFSGSFQLMDVTFQVLCNSCSSPLHLAQVQLLSFSGTIVFTQRDGFFSNIGGTQVFSADLTSRRPGQGIKHDAWTDKSVFKVSKDGNTVFIHSVVENYGNGTPEAARAVFTVFDNTAGALLGTFNSNTGTYTSQFENQTLTAAVPIFPVTSLIDDPKIMYWDTNANGVRDLGETVIYDTNGNGLYDPPNAAHTGDVALSGVVTPATGTALSDDPHIRFHDADSSGALSFACTDANDDPVDCTETVAYDANLNGVYDSGEPVLAGPNPPTGLIIGHTYSVTAQAERDTNGDGTPDTLGMFSATFSLKILP